MLRNAWIACALALAAFNSNLVLAAHTSHYKLTDLGDLTASRKQGATYPTGLDAKGDVIGRTLDAQFRSRAFLWQKGRMKDLGDFGQGTGQVIEAFAINDHAEIVGTNVSAATGLSRAFVWKGGKSRDLGSLNSTGTSIFAWSINAHADIVGAAYTAIGELRAVRWLKGGPIELGAMPDGRIAAQAFGINDKGLVVGYLSPGGSVAFAHAFIWNKGRFTDLGVLPGTNLSFANAVNEKGQVVGQSSNVSVPGGIARAFLWEDGTLLDLGTALPTDVISIANAINKSATVVGASGNSLTSTAWVWRNGVNQNLNALIDARDPNRAYVSLTKATGINDKDQIVAEGIDSRLPGTVRGYLLNPVK